MRTSIRVDRSGTPDSIPDVGSGFAQKIDATHYLIGTVGNHGLYQIHISPLP
ncbi:MAG: hypothetical protein KAH32_04320 [Chlamydiia bacterium]|nr:hypothetical protein [Chlamydiia bacterium]